MYNPEGSIPRKTSKDEFGMDVIDETTQKPKRVFNIIYFTAKQHRLFTDYTLSKSIIRAPAGM